MTTPSLAPAPPRAPRPSESAPAGPVRRRPVLRQHPRGRRRLVRGPSLAVSLLLHALLLVAGVAFLRLGPELRMMREPAAPPFGAPEEQLVYYDIDVGGDLGSGG